MIRILAPTDFLPTTEKAFRFAAHLASKTKGTVILFHVIDTEEIPYFDSTEKTNIKPGLKQNTSSGCNV
jgi:nucleotide-binding universal stress UspA family protein